MSFFRKILNLDEGPYFGSRIKEMMHFGKNLGKAIIAEECVQLQNYPHPASFYFKNGKIDPQHITAISFNSKNCRLYIEDEIIFVLKELQGKLQIFADLHDIPVVVKNTNWSYITEPFLDTEFTLEQQNQSLSILISHGFTEKEIMKLRKSIEQQLMKYNFDTQLMDWQELDLNDVLLAMKPIFTKTENETFYWQAMEIEMRAK